ncbi:MAG: glyoxylase-like metal-dependent hydrolase (beta-lactamase superfamily II) [Paraglaciecola sp.]|jgi:glyoxylase-like metal-dependent hydrolase (beta-lactamase superfamily II)
MKWRIVRSAKRSAWVAAALSCLFSLAACADSTTDRTIESQISDPAQSMADFCKSLPRAEYKTLERIKHNSEWFEVYQVAPGVTAIYEPHQWQEVISYLIEGENAALVFDTGNGIADLAAVINKLTDKPVSVLNSHSHYDHVGGNYAFGKIYGMDTPFSHKRQKGIANKDIAIEVSADALCRPLPSGVSEKSHLGRPYKVTDLIQHGSVIDLGKRQLEVIHVPGHTPDAIALIDREAGLMWTGDSFYAGTIWLYAPETDLAAYAQSLQKMVAEVPNLKALLPAHNTPWVAPQTLLRAQAGFTAMLAGKAQRVEQGDGMVEYHIPGDKDFSFLMRDEKLPYSQYK